jgi:hypothetical protein
MTPGILPFALRARLRRFKIAPGDFVSLHTGVAARADQRQKLERLCWYISRPAIAERRLSLTPNGNVRYQLKTPYRDGTTHVIFEPHLDAKALEPEAPRRPPCRAPPQRAQFDETG